MKTTCGIFLINKDRQILIGHPTGMSPKLWSIPKGLKEPNETSLDAAWREMTEETGLQHSDIADNFEYNLYILGHIDYTEKMKRLSAYGYVFDGVLTKIPICNSMFTCKRTKQVLPEVDVWRWVHYKIAFKYLNETQQSLLNQGIQRGIFQ